jgi:hypothetical protein
MKINPMQQSEIVSRYMNGAAKVPKAESTSAVSSSDSVELSSSAQEYATLLRNARTQMDQSDRAESQHADEILKQMRAGTYQAPDDQALTKALLSGGIPEYC